jgi:hypothetical protein
MDYEPETTENHRANHQCKDVCQAVYLQIVSNRNLNLPFPDPPCTMIAAAPQTVAPAADQ